MNSKSYDHYPKAKISFQLSNNVPINWTLDQSTNASTSWLVFLKQSTSVFENPCELILETFQKLYKPPKKLKFYGEVYLTHIYLKKNLQNPYSLIFKEL